MSLFSHGQHEDLGNGRLRTTIGLRPVNYFANGLFRPITSRLKNTGDPALPVGVDELVQFRLRDRLSGNAPLLHFGKGNSMVRLTPLNTANVTGRVFGENGFEYPNAWANADLRFIMGGHRLQKDIILKAGHPSSFAFRIDSHAGLDIATLATPDFRILTPTLEPPMRSAELARPLKWVVSQSGGKTVLTANLPPGDWAGWTLDPTLTLQPGAGDGLDTYIRSESATYPLGDNGNISIGDVPGLVANHRTLIKFDLSSLPSNATISSTTLSLYETSEQADNARTIRVYRQKRAWVEGTSAPGSGADWNTYDGGTAWQTAGGFGANDCEQTDIGSRNFSATETLNEFKDFALTPTTKAALDLGNGWLIKSDTEIDDVHFFSSSDHATAANRPKLVVEYTLLPPGILLRTKPMSFNWNWWGQR